MKKCTFFLCFWLGIIQPVLGQNPWGTYTNCSSGISFQVVLGMAQVDGTPLQPGDWVCAFDPNDAQAVGAGQVFNTVGSFSLIIYDCSSDPANGINDTEQLTLQYYDLSANSFYTLANIGVWSSSNNSGNFPGSGSTVPFNTDGTPDTQLAPPASLPVELISFKGEAKKEINRLSWITITEENTKLHRIERSIDGINNWEVVAEIDAMGFSLERVSYEAEDEAPLPFAYYRIHTYDFDDNENLSKVITIERKRAEIELKLYPNPSSGQIFIQGNEHKAGDLEIRVFDMMGQLVFNDRAEYESGVLNKSIDLSHISSGIYSCELIKKNAKETKLLVLR